MGNESANEAIETVHTVSGTRLAGPHNFLGRWGEAPTSAGAAAAETASVALEDPSRYSASSGAERQRRTQVLPSGTDRPAYVQKRTLAGCILLFVRLSIVSDLFALDLDFAYGYSRSDASVSKPLRIVCHSSFIAILTGAGAAPRVTKSRRHRKHEGES